MKAVFIIYLLSFSISCRTNAQKIERKDAANVLNTLDSLTETLGPPATNLVAYFQTIKKMAIEGTDYKLKNEQIDSLSQHLNSLTLAYGQAAQHVTNDKTMAKFPSLKTNFIELLSLGKEPWVTVVPVHLKMFSNGRSSLSALEQDTVNTSGEIFKKSAEKTLEWAKVVALQEEELEKKYHLELYNDKYR